MRRRAAGSVSRLLSHQTLPTHAARAAVRFGASAISRRRTAVAKRAALALETAASGTTSSIGGNGRAVAVASARVEVDGPRHGAAEAEIVGKLALHLVCLLVVVADPLVVPDELLHHRVAVEARRQVLLFDELLDLQERHDAVLVGALGRLAGACKGASEPVAAGIYHEWSVDVH
jgi:hypothetical protein